VKSGWDIQMSRKELNISIFEGTAKGVLWQPRLETWISYHRKNGSLPKRFLELDDLAIYDDLGCSVRYAASSGITRYNEPNDVEQFDQQLDENHYVRTLRIPEGELRIIHQVVRENGKIKNDRIKEFPVKTDKDIKLLTNLIGRQQFRADIDAFIKAAARVGDRAEPTIFLSGSGFTELIKEHCGLVNTFYLLHDYPAVVEEYLEACDQRDDRELETALKLPCRVFNLGDHATNEFTPPPILERYLLPRWQRISRRLTAESRFVHSHWDGNARLILPYLQKTGLHGVEALTPEPMGDITLKEIKEAVQDKMFVLDLIPAIYFLPRYTIGEVVEFAKKVINMFAPRLILGVSDEISEVGEIEKIEAISQLVEDLSGLTD